MLFKGTVNVVRKEIHTCIYTREVYGHKTKTSRLLSLRVHTRHSSGRVFFNLVLNINYAEPVNCVTSKECMSLNFYGH